MNPRTGQIEKVTGTTSDGHDIFTGDKLRLRWTWLCWEKTPANGIFSMWIETQKNATGRRLPHISIMCGQWLFQSGWLFG